MNHRYFIGLDAHCQHSYFVVMNRKGKILKRAIVDTTESQLTGFIQSVKGSKALAFDETTISQWLYMTLVNEVDELVVCSSAERRGAKNDFIDAAEHADLLRVGRLRPVYHSADKRMELRTLVSGYEDLVQDIVRAKNRYKALYRLSAVSTPGGRVYQDRKMMALLTNRTQKFVGKPLFNQIAFLEEQKTLYLKKFKQNLKQYPEMKRIASIPGMREVRVNQIVGILVTPERFANKYRLFSYAMLVKHKQMSDGRLYGLKKSYGNQQLRAIFKSATRNVISTRLLSTNAFRRKYDQMIAEGKTQKAARNAVARALAATVLGVWKSGEKYNDYHREVAQRNNGCRKN